MARINVEDDIESMAEWKRLVRALQGDDNRAMGMLVFFWRHAQRLWGHGELVPESDITEWGWEPLVAAGWAKKQEGGYYALGARDRFAWYRQRVAAGETRARAERDSAGRFTSETTIPRQRETIPHQPLSPSPAPSPSPVLQERERHSQPLNAEGIKICTETWHETLDHFRCGRPNRTLIPGEDVQIARAIQRWGAKPVELALFGARFEPKDDRFDPSKFVRLKRYLDPEHFDRFVNLGVGAKHRGAA